MPADDKQSGLVQGTLHMLILKTLALEPMHGYGIGVRLEQISKGVFQVNAGSLFPALRRLERDGLIAGEWRVTENNRRAKYYTATAQGRAKLRTRNARLGGADDRHRPDSESVAGRAVMRLLSRAVGGLRALLRKTRVEQELDAELRDFLDAAVEQKMRTGMSREAAVRSARLELGSPEAVKDHVRDVGWESLDRKRVAGRALRGPQPAQGARLHGGGGAHAVARHRRQHGDLQRDPGAPAASSAGAPCGRTGPAVPRPAGAAARECVLLPVRERARRAPRDLRRRVRLRRGDDDGRPGARVDGAWVTGEYYDTLGLVPAAGRLLTPDDDRPGAAPVVVITDGYWKRRFGGDPSAIGRTIRVYGAPVTIVGVTAPGFTGTTVGQVADLTLPLGSRSADAARAGQDARCRREHPERDGASARGRIEG